MVVSIKILFTMLTNPSEKTLLKNIVLCFEAHSEALRIEACATLMCFPTSLPKINNLFIFLFHLNSLILFLLGSNHVRANQLK